MMTQSNKATLPVFRWGPATTYACFILFTLVVLVPVYWIVRSSLANASDLYKTPLVYFPPVTLKNFQTLTEQVPFVQYVTNSLLFATGTSLLTLLVSFMAAYAFARLPFPGSGS